MFDRQPNMNMYLVVSVVLVFALNQVRDIASFASYNYDQGGGVGKLEGIIVLGFAVGGYCYYFSVISIPIQV